MSSPPLIKYYFEEQQNVQTKFGEKTILFMMVGMFYEVYELEKKGFANVVSEKCGILLTRKNKSLDISPSNPWMCGFPCPSLSKFIKKLHVFGYSVAVYDQNQTNPTEDKNDIRRILSGVYSPSSPMELLLPSSSSSENEQHHEKTTLTPRGVFCIYREKVGQPLHHRYHGIHGNHGNHGNHSDCLWNGYGIYIDYDSGKVLGLMWSQSTLSAWRSETMMYLQRYHPREIYLYPGLEEEMELWKGSLFLKWMPKMEQKDWDVSYQILVLEKMFGKKPNDQVIILERLHLDRCQEWTAMLVNVLNFLYLHHPLLVFRLKPPQFQEDTNHLKCNQDLYEELNIFSGNPSLFQLTDKTCTAWGSRLWRRQLMTPTCDTEILNRRWNSIQNLLHLLKKEKGGIERIRKGIQQFPSDPWMFWRRWECKKYQPTMALTMMTKMYFLLHDALTLVEEVMPIPKSQEWSKEPFSVLSKDKIREAILFFENILCSSDKEESGGEYVKKLDWKASQKIRKRTEEEWKKFQEKFKKIDYLEEFGVKWKEEENEIYIVLPNANAKKRMYIRKSEAEKVLREHRWYATGIKWFHPEMDEAKRLFLQKQQEQQQKDGIEQEESMEKFYQQYHTMMEEMWYWVGHWDVVQSCSLVSLTFGYTRPLLLTEAQQVLMKEIRHPILERVHEQVQFIGNDLEMGDSKKGMLIYGHNSAGKSTFLKSVGLGIWLAQVGMYVPAKSFEFKPFHQLFSKMGTSDNLYKGQSTFVVEMMELRHFLHYANDRTLILCDELTAGTETCSATGIVASAISQLRKKKSYFLFTTHLHTLQIYEELMRDEKLVVVHFPMERENNEIKFSRKYLPGMGNMLYGIEIAETLSMDSEFIQQAFHYRQQLLGLESQNKTPEIVPSVKSMYNRKLYKTQCMKCGLPYHNPKHIPLHTHHIVPQKEATENGMIGHFHKNSLFNLENLCETCHQEEHKNH